MTFGFADIVGSCEGSRDPFKCVRFNEISSKRVSPIPILLFNIRTAVGRVTDPLRAQLLLEKKKNRRKIFQRGPHQHIYYLQPAAQTQIILLTPHYGVKLFECITLSTTNRPRIKHVHTPTRRHKCGRSQRVCVIVCCLGQDFKW